MNQATALVRIQNPRLAWTVMQLGQREVHDANAAVSGVEEMTSVAQLTVHDAGGVQTVNRTHTSAAVLLHQNTNYIAENESTHFSSSRLSE